LNHLSSMIGVGRHLSAITARRRYKTNFWISLHICQCSVCISHFSLLCDIVAV